LKSLYFCIALSDDLMAVISLADGCAKVSRCSESCGVPFSLEKYPLKVIYGFSF
jgi:hypothetical protein